MPARRFAFSGEGDAFIRCIVRPAFWLCRVNRPARILYINIMELSQTDWAAKWAVYRPRQIAFKAYESGQELTYADLNRRAEVLGHYLTQELGLRQGDRLAILAENGLDYLLLFTTAQKTGLILVPLNYRLTGGELDYLLRDAEPQLLVVEDKFRPLIEAAPQAAAVPHRWVLSQVADYSELASDVPPPPILELSADDPIFILYTSGTTGFPKGAIYTHGMLFWNSINTALSLIVNTESRTVNCMPPFHTGGWNVLTTPFLHHGGYTCLLKQFDAATVLRALSEERATLFMGVPTMLKMMADLPEFATADLSSLHYIIVGGEPMPIPLIERWQSRGVAIRQGYGMTEVGPNLTSLHQDDCVRKKGSIGRPNFYVQTRIVDAAGRNCAAGQAGELWLRGPMVTPGYWRNEAASRSAVDEGWFRTGDRVMADEEGYLYVVDRIKNMFISGGENVYPAEIERIIIAHPAVAEVAVVGISDDQWGEVGRAYIVAQPGQEVSAADIIPYCRERLARYKVPKSVVVLPSLPKSATGKIDRQALKQRGECPSVE